MSKVSKTSVLIDTLSIQSYIFGSTRLKENIGGSYIIECEVYNKLIPEAMTKSGIKYCDHWNQDPERYELQNAGSSYNAEAGYIGGGNAMLIFSSRSDAENFIKCYSRLLLEKFPGIKTAFGLLEGDPYTEGDDYKKFREELVNKLLQNRHMHFSQVLPFKQGIGDDCPETGECQERWSNLSSRWVSAMSDSRTLAEIQDKAKSNLQNQFKDIIGDRFNFTDELDKLGQPGDKGYLAIVHADGNGMGSRFMKCRSLKETRKLSSDVAKYAQQVMSNLMKEIVGLFTPNPRLSNFNLSNADSNNQVYLPVRPLIVGGDDITLVCEGRLGLWMAERLIHHMQSIKVYGINIHACAGVSIVHTKYPFYKAYQLSEELTKSAKEKSREIDSSWIAYMISSGGFSGSLDDILKEQYDVPAFGCLKNGPYRIGGDEDHHSFQKMKKGMRHFSSGWPRNKIKLLRDVLRRPKVYQDLFLTEMRTMADTGDDSLKLPFDKKSLWESSNTPFYDMIELLDFYPKELLDTE